MSKIIDILDELGIEHSMKKEKLSYQYMNNATDIFLSEEDLTFLKLKDMQPWKARFVIRLKK